MYRIETLCIDSLSVMTYGQAMQPTIMLRGVMSRSPVEQVALAVRILDGCHFSDVYDQAKKQLGNRAKRLGPLDLSRNTLKVAVERINKVHRPSPFVDDLTDEMAALMGDQSARVTVDRYRKAGGRPMPTSQVAASSRATTYRIGAGYAGLLLGWADRPNQLFQQVIKPDALRLTYASDDPTEPTVIEHFRRRMLGKEVIECTDVYDLTDLDSPRFRVLRGGRGVSGGDPDGRDITDRVLTPDEVGDGYWWVDDDGRPYHRIVITGDPHDPYRTNSLVETTLKVCVYWTHWGAGIVDAGHPRTHTIGLELEGADSAQGEIGTEAGPEIAYRWRHIHPETPGDIIQHGPGFDPKVIGEAVRGYEMSAMTALGIPIDHASTGGEPTETEQRELREVIASHYDECRRFDSEILRRSALILSKATGEQFDSTPYGVLYREEVAEALGAVKAAEEAAEEQDDGGSDDGSGGRGDARPEAHEGDEPDAA